MRFKQSIASGLVLFSMATTVSLSQFAIAQVTPSQRQYADQTELARKYTKTGDWKQALAALTLAIESNPIGVQARVARAGVYNKLKRYQDSITDATKAIELDPRLSSAYIQRANAYWDLGKKKEARADALKVSEFDKQQGYLESGILYNHFGDYERAVTAFTKHIAGDPTDAYGYADRGYAYQRLGKWWQAIGDYSVVLQLRPTDRPALFDRAVCYEHLEMYDSALEDLQKLLVIKPDSRDYLIDRGYCYARADRLAEAAADFLAILKRQPRDAHANYQLARVYEKQGKFAEALKSINVALSEEPKNISYLNERGHIYLSMKNLVMAKSDYAQAILLKKDSDAPVNKLEKLNDYYLYRAADRAGEEEHKLAIADYTEVLKSDPKNEDALTGRGGEYYETYVYDKAADDYTRLIDGGKGSAYIYECRGGVYLYQDQLDKALADLKEAIKLEPDASAYESLARCYLGLRKYDEALSAVQSGTKIDPKDESLRTVCGDIYMAMGKPKDAVKEYNLAVVLHSPDELESLSKAYQQLGEWQNAFKDIDHALMVDPHTACNYVTRGCLFAATGNMDKAIADCEKALTLKPVHMHHHSDLGFLYEQSGQREKAKEQYKAALARYSKDLDDVPWFAAYNDLAAATAYAGLQQYDDALKACDKAWSRFNGPEYADDINFERFRAYNGLGKTDEALKAINAAIEHSPMQRSFLSARAGLHERLGNKELAAADQARAKSLQFTYAPVVAFTGGAAAGSPDRVPAPSAVPSGLPGSNDVSPAKGGTGTGAAAKPDFGLFMADLQRRIKRSWFPPKGHESKRIMVFFKLNRDGKMSGLRLEQSSGIPVADQAALLAVSKASPFRPLPQGAPSNVDIQFTFDYNLFNGSGGGRYVPSSTPDR